MLSKTENLPLIGLFISIFVVIIMGFVMGAFIENLILKDVNSDIGKILNQPTKISIADPSIISEYYAGLISTEPLIVGYNIIDSNDVIINSDEPFLVGKLFSEYGQRTASKDGLFYRCKHCRRLEWETNKERNNFRKREYRKNNLKKVQEQEKRHWEQNKEKISEKNKKWRDKNKNIISKNKKEYWFKNKKKIKKYRKNKYHDDPIYKLTISLRNRLRHAINGSFKSGSAVRDLGCSIEELKIHLEKQFKPGMSWENHSFHGWHIDHIEPLISFDLTNRKQLLKACHYSNLQPLWKEENLSKGEGSIYHE